MDMRTDAQTRLIPHIHESTPFMDVATLDSLFWLIIGAAVLWTAISIAQLLWARHVMNRVVEDLQRDMEQDPERGSRP